MESGYMSKESGSEGFLLKITFSAISPILFPLDMVADKVLSAFGKRVRNWWVERGQVKEAERILEELAKGEMCSKHQVDLARGLISYVRSDDIVLRRELSTHKPLSEILLDRLLKLGWLTDDKERAKRVISGLIEYLRDIIVRCASLGDIFRAQTKLKEEVISFLRFQEKRLRELADIGLLLPTSFSPLHSRLDFIEVLHAFQQEVKGEMSEEIIRIIEPQFFRKPRPNWIDFGTDGSISVREDIINQIEENFKSSNMQLLIGESGSGKTTLAYVLGHQRLNPIWGPRQPVFYIDFIEHSDLELERDIREVFTALANTDGLQRGVLFILDNVHLNPRICSRLYEKLRISKLSHQSTSTDKNELLRNVDILFVARTLHSTLDESVKHLQEEITPGSKGLLSVTTLEKSDFISGVRSIVSQFFNRHHIEMDDSTRDNLLHSILETVEGSLWLLKFVMNAFQKELKNTEKVPETMYDVNICEEIREHYSDGISSVYNHATSPESGLSLEFLDGELARKRLFVDILLSIGTFTQIEVPIPEEYVIKSVATDDSSHRVSIMLKEKLLELGELVLSVMDHRRFITLPHPTLARHLTECYHPELGIGTFGDDFKQKCIDILQYYKAQSIDATSFVKRIAREWALSVLRGTTYLKIAPDLRPLYNLQQIYIMMDIAEWCLTHIDVGVSAWIRLAFLLNQIKQWPFEDQDAVFRCKELSLAANKRSYDLDPIYYSILVDSLDELGRRDEAESVLREVMLKKLEEKESGFTPLPLSVEAGLRLVSFLEEWSQRTEAISIMEWLLEHYHPVYILKGIIRMKVPKLGIEFLEDKQWISETVVDALMNFNEHDFLSVTLELICDLGLEDIEMIHTALLNRIELLEEVIIQGALDPRFFSLFGLLRSIERIPILECNKSIRKTIQMRVPDIEYLLRTESIVRRFLTVIYSVLDSKILIEFDEIRDALLWAINEFEYSTEVLFKVAKNLVCISDERIRVKISESILYNLQHQNQENLEKWMKIVESTPILNNDTHIRLAIAEIRRLEENL